MGTWTAPDGARLSFEERGTGAPPVVLLHGWQSAGATWAAMAPRLAARYRTIVADLRGCGASAGAAGPYTVEQSSEDVALLLRDVVRQPAVVAGHSMGGAIAMRLAVDHPELLRGIVLIATVPPSGLRLPEKVDAIFRGTAGNVANFERWLRRQSLAPLPDEHVAALLAAAATVSAGAATEAYESWTQLDFAGEVRRITTPTLVVPGESDSPNLDPERLRTTVADLIPNARMAVIARSGHYVPLEQPQATADAMVRFIEDTLG